jgi:potassium efflux system protein
MLSGMAMKNNFISWLIIFILFAVFTDNFAQGQSNQQTEPKEKEVRIYKVSEIPAKIEDASGFLSEIYTDLLKPEEVKKLETELNDILKNFSSLRSRTDSINIREQLTIILKELKQRWNTQKKKISDYTKQISGRIEKLEEQKKTLIENKSIWLRTDSLAGMEKANTKIRIKISDILDEFNKVENRIANDINKLLDLQTGLSKERALVNSTLQKLDNLLAAKKREIFVRNAPPIWESISGREDTTNLSYQVKYIRDSYSRISKAFYEENKDKIVPGIIYFLILLSLILILRHYTKNFRSEDPVVERAQEILKAPVSASIIISLIALSLIYSDAPEFYSSLIRILVVLPLIFVLRRIISNTLRMPLYLFALILILEQIRLTIENNTGVERVLLILINVIVLAVLVWMLRTKRFDKAFSTKSYNDKAVILTKITIVLFSITLMVNFLGYVALSFMLVNGMIISVYGIIIIITAALTLEGVIMIILQTKLAGLLNVVNNYPDKIHRVIHKILKLVFSVWAVIIILNNFGVRKIVTDWLVETLGHEWSIGDFSISLGALLLFIVSIWLSIITARFVRFILEGDVLPRFDLARGVPGAVSIISSYVIIGFGIIVAIRGAGFDLNSFALLAGALGVGIGFGLQDIVKNFISGLIIIFERPIQIGDAVQVEDLSGRVQHIGIRSSIIKTWEGAEVIVPNGNLISNKLINWTFADQLRRIDVKVGVAYGTNVNLVMETLLECARQHEKLLVSPPPLVLFNEFGESSLDFELRCWTSDFGTWFQIKSDLRISIEKAFREQNIEIPFPQRDLHLNPRSATD